MKLFQVGLVNSVLHCIWPTLGVTSTGGKKDRVFRQAGGEEKKMDPFWGLPRHQTLSGAASVYML